MTRKSDHEKVKMETDDGAFNEALDRADLGIVLQSGLGDRTVHKVHAPATLWMATKVKVERKFVLVYVFTESSPLPVTRRYFLSVLISIPYTVYSHFDARRSARLNPVLFFIYFYYIARTKCGRTR